MLFDRAVAFPVTAVLLPLVGAALAFAPEASATRPFRDVFIDQYLADHPDRDYVDFVRRQARCYTCHQGKKDRRNCNAYGTELAKYLDAEADRENAAKVLAVLHEAENAPVDPSQPDGPTFGDRIKASLLPAGDLEDAKRESAD
jgi:hypothetical protein